MDKHSNKFYKSLFFITVIIHNMSIHKNN
jgi:hypothetical protein